VVPKLGRKTVHYPERQYLKTGIAHVPASFSSAATEQSLSQDASNFACIDVTNAFGGGHLEGDGRV
jgi:hypothetical protein